MEKQNLPQIVYRWLNSDEMELMRPAHEENGWPMPYYNYSALGAFDGDRLVGFLICQMVPHTEPFWIDEEYRHAGVWSFLCGTMLKAIKDSKAPIVYVQSSNPTSAMIAAKCGFEPMKHELWVLNQTTVDEIVSPQDIPSPPKELEDELCLQ